MITQVRGVVFDRRLQWVLEVLGLSVLLIAVALHAWFTADIHLWDEADYLSRGEAISRGEWPAFTNGALYSDLYAMGSLIYEDRVALAIGMRVAMAVLIVLAVWIAARLLSTGMLAWSAAMVIAVTGIPYVVPGAGQPATATLIIAVAVLLRYPSPMGLGASASLLWLGAAARPEYVWVASLTSLLAVAMLCSQLVRRTGPGASKALGVSLTALGVPFILMTLHGSAFAGGSQGWPFLGQEIPRDWLAFAQNFSLRFSAPGEDPWLDWAAITDRTFPGAESVTDAALANPGAFFAHLLHNIALTPTIALQSILGLPGLVALGVLLLGFLVSLASGRRDVGRKLARLAEWAKQPATAIAIGVVVLAGITTLVPITILFPREHYLVPAITMGAIALAALQTVLGSARFQALIPLSASIVVFSVTTVWRSNDLFDRQEEFGRLARAVDVLNGSPRSWTVLALDQGLNAYVDGWNSRRLPPPRMHEQFMDYLDRVNVDALLLNARFARGKWAQAQGFDAFLQDPRAYGFAPTAPGSPLWIRDASAPPD